MKEDPPDSDFFVFLKVACRLDHFVDTLNLIGGIHEFMLPNQKVNYYSESASEKDTGIGLYISRNFMRSANVDLTYRQQDGKPEFLITLHLAQTAYRQYKIVHECKIF